jgi:chemotaxis protein MotB
MLILQKNTTLMLVNTRTVLLLSFFLLTIASCVSSKKFKSQVARYDSLKTDYNVVEDQLRTCLTDRDAGTKRNEELQQENEFMKQNYTSILNQLRDLSVLSSTQAESIKKSMENLNTKDAYIKDLQISMSKKDSLNMALVMNLKGALKDINDEDVQIKVEGSAVFISISDKMLFKSGSYDISPESKNVLGKVAEVIKAQPDIQFMVEGHTDNKPIKTAFIKDNWDLSVLRATAVTRTLQKEYGVDPKRMIAAGRSEYESLGANDTPEGRTANRRTRIVILPQLDQFFKLMEPKR